RCLAPDLCNPCASCAARYSFSCVFLYAAATTATFSTLSLHDALPIYGSDGSQVTSSYGSFARIPSGDGFFALPATDTYLIEVTSAGANTTRTYSEALAD